ncbi:MAG: hypothetical protein ACJATA_000198 [Sphingobacteriales bacterium]|jgi:hypothetical protein
MQSSNFDRTKSMIISWLDPEALKIIPPSDWRGIEKLEQVEANVKMIENLTGNKPFGIVALLPDFTQTEETLHYYRENIHLAVCLAMVGDSFVKKIAGNFLLRTLGPKTN